MRGNRVIGLIPYIVQGNLSNVANLDLDVLQGTFGMEHLIAEFERIFSFFRSVTENVTPLGNDRK